MGVRVTHPRSGSACIFCLLDACVTSVMIDSEQSCAAKTGNSSSVKGCNTMNIDNGDSEENRCVRRPRAPKDVANDELQS